MGTTRHKTEDTVKETAKVLPMLDCCSFAATILDTANNLTYRYIDNKWEINSEIISSELRVLMHSYLSHAENLDGYSPKAISFCHDPKIEGGNNYSLYVKRKDLAFDVFIYSVGFKLNNYCCHLVRTRRYCSTEEAEKNYEFIEQIFEEILEHLRDGIALRQVYEMVQSFAEKNNPHLAKCLEKEFGFELGPNFKNESVAINSNSKVIAQKDMFFAININLIGLKEDGIEYSLCHTDTVVVRSDLPARLLSYFEFSRTEAEPSLYENLIEGDLLTYDEHEQIATT